MSEHFDADDEAGEAVCWLNLVCPECGRIREDRTLDQCAYCGTPTAEDPVRVPGFGTRNPDSDRRAAGSDT
jgi:hypothetical protein